MNMKYGKKITLAIFFSLSLILVSNSINALPYGLPFPGDPISVGPDPEQYDYTSISEAIQNADEDSIIEVAYGEYNDNIVIDKRLLIRGDEENFPTIISATGSDESVVQITADGCTFKNFIVTSESRGPTLDAGIEIWSEDNTVSNNIIITDSYDGINIETDDVNPLENNTIVGNNIYNAGNAGIRLVYSHENRIENNEIFDSYYGMWISYSDSSIISGNTLDNNNVNILIDGSNGNMIDHNNFIKGVDPSYKNALYTANNCDNIWDDGEEGNYWSDYDGSDNDEDSIGDTPYNIYDFSGTTLCDSDDFPKVDIIVTTYVAGDADGSGGVDIDDVVFMIDYIFSGGPAPDPVCLGDADSSGEADIDDVVFLINYIFSGGPAPEDIC